MKKRTNQILIRVNEKELQKINKLAKKSGLSREEFLRSAAFGCTFKERPSADFFETIRLLRICGDNINQIAKKLNSCYEFDVEEYEKNYDSIQKWIEELLGKYG